MNIDFRDSFELKLIHVKCADTYSIANKSGYEDQKLNFKACRSESETFGDEKILCPYSIHGHCDRGNKDNTCKSLYQI
jgi:hypothetical protein